MSSASGGTAAGGSSWLHDQQGITRANCKECHPQQYEQFARSRHGVASWAAVYGESGSKDHPLTAEQVAQAEKFIPEARRPANALVSLEEARPCRAAA